MEGSRPQSSSSCCSSNRPSSSLWGEDIVMSPEVPVTDNVGEDEVVVEETSTPKEKATSKFVSVLIRICSSKINAFYDILKSFCIFQVRQGRVRGKALMDS